VPALSQRNQILLSYCLVTKRCRVVVGTFAFCVDLCIYSRNQRPEISAGTTLRLPQNRGALNSYYWIEEIACIAPEIFQLLQVSEFRLRATVEET